MRRLVVAAAIAALALMGQAGPAAAHAAVQSTTPASGAVLEAPPDELVIRFDQRVTADDDSVRLHDASGGTVGIGELVRADGGRTLRARVDGLEPGGYVVTYRVVSEDGHPINGGVTWRLGRQVADVEPSVLERVLNADDGDAAVRAAAAVARALLFAALVVLVGGLLFLVAVWPAGAAQPGLRRLLVGSGAVGAVTTLLGMGLQGAETNGDGVTDALSPRAALDTWDTDFGKAAVARLVLVLLLTGLAVLATPRRAAAVGWRVAAVAGAAATLLTLTLAGHARTGRWVAVAVPVDLVHLGAAATWIGGLVVLALVVLRRLGDDAEGAAVAARFSRVAAAAVGVVVLTGVVQGLRQVGELEGLRTTSYGRLLVTKVAVVAVVVVLGARSRSLVRARLAPPGDDAPGSVDPGALRRSVVAEVAVAALVLGATSLLVASDPARAEQARAFLESRVVDGSIIEVQVAPARTGPVDLHVYLVDQSIGLSTPLVATARLSLPGTAFEGIEVPIRPAGGRHWSTYDLEVPAAGEWRLHVVVRVGRLDERSATFTVPID